MDEARLNERLSEITAEIAAIKSEIKTLFTQQKEQRELLESVHDLARAVDRQTVILEQQGRDIDTLKTDLTTIKERPQKRWDIVITAAITAIVTFVFSRLGLK